MKSMRLAMLVDSDIWERSILGVTAAHELAQAIATYIPETRVFSTGRNYEEGVREIAVSQNEFDYLLVICFFFRLITFNDLFKFIKIPVAIMENDACQNYNKASPFFGMWSQYLRDNNIALIGVTGLVTHENLSREGFGSFYLPKAAPERFLQVKNSQSGWICTFGNIEGDIYFERAKVLGRVVGRKLLMRIGLRMPIAYRLAGLLGWGNGVDMLRFPFEKMPRILSKYSACVICDLGLREPMAKHFEAASLGVVPIRDDESVEELGELGFNDGESMVLYSDVDDLVTKLEYYRRNPEDLIALQGGARKAASHHTWHHRANRLREILEARL